MKVKEGVFVVSNKYGAVFVFLYTLFIPLLLAKFSFAQWAARFIISTSRIRSSESINPSIEAMQMEFMLALWREKYCEFLSEAIKRSILKRITYSKPLMHLLLHIVRHRRHNLH
jgi:hypothetical protein